MKRFSLLVMIAALLFFAGCGGGGNDYDQYDDSGDSDSVRPDNDADKDSDTGDTVTPDQDNETPDSDETDTGEPDNDSDGGDTGTKPSEDFWSTCEGIIACCNGCVEGDSDCKSDCYGAGTAEEQLNYRRWRECFDEKCAEDKTAECSAENCAEWDELCNVADAFEYEVTIPAPYGVVSKLKGDFSYILDNVYPSSETGILFESFVEGNVSSTSLPLNGTTLSFVRKGTNKRDGEVLDVYQAPFDSQSQKVGNPVVILRIKIDSATVGTHDIGVLDENSARLIVGDMDEHFTISCYHAFGIGSFSIDKAEIKAGAEGRLSVSGSGIELFHPQNIPELGGDATETLGVEACSLI